jgi:hypothetical protein
MNTTKILKWIDDGLWTPYASGYEVYVYRLEPDYDRPYVAYRMAFHKGAMPPHTTIEYQSLAELVSAMYQIQADFRRWRKVHPDLTE